MNCTYNSLLHSEYIVPLTPQLLHIDPEQRMQTLQAVQSHPAMTNLDFEKVKAKAVKPLFVPSVSVMF